MEDSYLELAVGSVSNRAQFIKSNEIHKHIKPKEELYKSLFLLDESCKDIKTIKEYKGIFSIDRIPFDIDFTNTGEETVNNARKLVDEIVSRGCSKSNINIWFSGRGFHIEIPNLYNFLPDKNLPLTMKRVLQDHFGKNNIDNIYDRGRLYRVGFTFNIKSNLYKTPIKHSELFELTYDDIIKIAKDQRMSFQFEKAVGGKPQWKYNVKEKVEQKEEFSSTPSSSTHNSNVTCVQKMVADPKKHGHRHRLALRMASAWRRMGITQDIIHGMCKASIPSLDMKEIVRLVKSVFKEPYSYSCDDEYMVKYCDPICKYYKYKNYDLDVKNVETMSKDFEEFVLTDFTETSFDFKDIYDIPNNYKFHHGELAVLIGDTKLGKTAWLQNVVSQLTDMKCLYLSLEVHHLLIFRRFLQIANNMTKEQVIDVYRSKNYEKQREIESKIKHIYVRTSSPDIESIGDLISEVQPKIVVVDTIDGINVRYTNDAFYKMEKIVLKLKDIAQQRKVIMLGISHISKGATYDQLNVHSAKGNSAIEQKADKILGITGDRDKGTRRSVKGLASRDETNFNLQFKFDFDTFRFIQTKGEGHW